MGKDFAAARGIRAVRSRGDLSGPGSLNRVALARRMPERLHVGHIARLPLLGQCAAEWTLLSRRIPCVDARSVLHCSHCIPVLMPACRVKGSILITLITSRLCFGAQPASALYYTTAWGCAMGPEQEAAATRELLRVVCQRGLCRDVQDVPEVRPPAGRIDRHSMDMPLIASRSLVLRTYRYHIMKNEHTWLTDDLIAALDQMRRDPAAGIQMCAFELWEGRDLVAASFGYASITCLRPKDDARLCVESHCTACAWGSKDTWGRAGTGWGASSWTIHSAHCGWMHGR